MVDPLDLHHMVGQTPLVEKTVAAQRENAQQLHNQNAQFQRVRQHAEERIERHRESSRIEPKAEHPGGGPESGGHPRPRPEDPAAEEEHEGVKLVSEDADEPRHQLDVTI